MNFSIVKIFFRLKENIFGKYYDEKIWKDLNKFEVSDIFPADMLLVQG